MARTVTSGPLAVQTKETDGSIWIPATRADIFTGTWTKTRTAAGNIVMLKTDADDTSPVSFDLTAGLLDKVGTDPTTSIGRSHDIRGYQVRSIDVLWKNESTSGADLEAFTYDIYETTYSNGSAPAVTSTVGGTLSGTFTLTKSDNPRLETITVGTPFVIGANTARVIHTLELTINAAATSTVHLYGIFLNVHYNLL